MWTHSMLTPISAAVSWSWNVARMARPSLVRWINACDATIRASATTKTNRRSGAIEIGPQTTGAVGNGCWIDFATPPQVSSSAFCSAIQTPIISSIVVSIDSRRSGASSRSTSAPSNAPPTIAATIASRKLGARTLSVKKATYAPKVYSSPCAKLTTPIRPKIKVSPIPSSAYVPPMINPLTRSCGSTSNVRLAGRSRAGSPYRP